jgi:hypothetical protein
VTDFAELAVKINNWLGHGLKGIQALFQGLCVVILPLNCRAGSSAQTASHQGGLVDIVEENVLAFADMLLEVNGLVNSSGEAVNQIVLGGPSNETVYQDLDCELKWHESTFSHDLSDPLSILGALKH